MGGEAGRQVGRWVGRSSTPHLTPTLTPTFTPTLTPTRRRGARLSDGTVMDNMQPGDRFVGEPLSSVITYKCVIEVRWGRRWDARGWRSN